MSAITNRQRSPSEFLRKIPPLLRFLLGLFGSAVFAFYVPMILVTFTGKWINNLTMWLEVGLAVTVLMVQNIIGNSIRRIMPTAVVFSGLILLYYAQFLARLTTLGQWREWWQLFFVPLLACLLNGYFLLKYKRVSGL
jgi:hypothetical protein